jgi:hypothetical protein
MSHEAFFSCTKICGFIHLASQTGGKHKVVVAQTAGWGAGDHCIRQLGRITGHRWGGSLDNRWGGSLDISGEDHWTAGGEDHWTTGGKDHWTTGGEDHWTAGGEDHWTTGGEDHWTTGGEDHWMTAGEDHGIVHDDVGHDHSPGLVCTSQLTKAMPRIILLFLALPTILHITSQVSVYFGVFVLER